MSADAAAHDFTLADEPFDLFAAWLKDAEAKEINDPNAMALATVDETGLPNVRMVLLKGFDRTGFVFYTNYESRKGRELLGQGKAALLFHWKSLRRQVRVRGPVEPVDAAEADAYFASRPRGSRAGALVGLPTRPGVDRVLAGRPFPAARPGSLRPRRRGLGPHAPLSLRPSSGLGALPRSSLRRSNTDVSYRREPAD
jgi:hypothetical protein